MEYGSDMGIPKPRRARKPRAKKAAAPAPAPAPAAPKPKKARKPRAKKAAAAPKVHKARVLQVVGTANKKPVRDARYVILKV